MAVLFGLSLGRSCAHRFIAVALLTLVCAVVLPAKAGAEPSIEMVGTLPIGAADGSVVDRASGNLLVFGPSSDRSGTLRIRSFDVDTLHKGKDVTYPQYTTLSGPPVFAWNPARRLLYLVVAGTAASSGASLDEQLLVVDSSLKVVSAQSLAAPAGVMVKGISFDVSSGLLYIAEESHYEPENLDRTVALAAYDPVRAAFAWPTQAIAIPECAALVSKDAQAAVAYNARTTSLYVACAASGTGLTPGLPAIAAVDVTDTLKPTIKMYQMPGGFWGADSFSDQAAGRLLVSSNGSEEKVIWIFDETHATFVGSVSAGSAEIDSVGIDDETGQTYVGVGHTVLVGSDRGLTSPQLLAFHTPHLTPIHGIVHVIPMKRRFAVRLQAVTLDGSVDTSEAPFYGVYEDHLDPYQEFTPPNPDDQTVNVAEAPGKTQSIYRADSAAYGFRMHEVGGVQGVFQNVSSSHNDYWGIPHQLTSLNDGDREVWGSRIPAIQLDPGASTAHATSLATDDFTKGDYATLTKEKWTDTSAACVDLGKGASSDGSQKANVQCNLAGAHTVATSKYDAQFLAFAPQYSVTLSSSVATSDIRKDPVLGTVVDTQAVARDLTFMGPGGVAYVGSVTAVVEARAHGRPGTARATYTRSFENVIAPGYSCTTACDVSSVLRAIDSALLGEGVRVEAPAPSITQTPKGAQASVVLDPWEGRQREVLANDDPTHQEVPALRVSVILDSVHRSRLVLDFAAVQATASYDVFTIAPSTSFAPVPPTTLVTRVLQSLPGPARVPVGDDVIQETVRNPGHPGGLLLLLPPASLLPAMMWGLLGFPLLVSSRRRQLLRVLGRRP